MRPLTISILAVALAMPAAPAFAQTAASAGQAPAAAPTKIVDKSDPEYVKCRMEGVIGSRAKKRKVCMTNREWEEVGRNGNRLANKLVEDARAGFLTQN